MSEEEQRQAAMHELLKGLYDIRLPDPIGWWPPAPGWWLVAALLLLAAMWLARQLQLLPWLRSLPYRRSALLELRQLQQPRSDSTAAERLGALARLLRRVVRTAYPQHPAIAGTGIGWLKFLDRCSGMHGFSQGKGRCLAMELYRPQPNADLAAVEELVRRWIVRHRPLPPATDD